MTKASIPLADFLSIQKNQYTTLKITSHKSVKNGNSFTILTILDDIRKDLKDLVRVESKKYYKFPMLKKIVIEQQNKVTYIIEIKNGELNFYFIYPKQYDSIFKEKLRDVYTQVKFEEVEPVSQIVTKQTYFLTYKYDDALSTRIDRRDNYPLNNILNVAEVVTGEDLVRITYNFTALSAFEKSAFSKRYESTMEKIKNHENIIKNKKSRDYMKQAFLRFVEGFFRQLDDIVLSLTLGPARKEMAMGNMEETMANIIFNQLNNNYQLQEETKDKNTDNLLNTEIVIQSLSIDKDKAKQNATSVYRAFNSIKGDNQLEPLKASAKERKINPYGINICKVKNVMSYEESGQLLQLPGRELCERFGIEHIKNLETKVPQELQEGIMCIGKNFFRENQMKAFLSSHPEYMYLTLCLVGPTRAGKSTLIANIIKDGIDNGQCAIVIDWIDKCQLSYSIMKAVGVERCKFINLRDLKHLPPFEINEIKPEGDTVWELYSCAKKKSSLILQLLDCINGGDEDLRSRMERYLKASLIVNFMVGGTFMDCIMTLQSPNFRDEVVAKVTEDMKKYLQLSLESLEELTKYEDSKKKNENGEKIFTKVNNNYLISGIINRIERLKDNPMMERMMDMATNENNIDLTEEIQKNQAIIILMPDKIFGSDQEKDVMATYWFSRVYAALQYRNAVMPDKDKIPLSLVIDEIYTVPNCQAYFKTVLSRIAKYRAKPIISCHHLNQLHMKDELKSANTSYMFLAGCDTDNYKEMKNKFEYYGYAQEDLLSLREHQSLNIIKTQDGSSAFITLMPPPRWPKVEDIDLSWMDEI